jgi:hypothetical protein
MLAALRRFTTIFLCLGVAAASSAGAQEISGVVRDSVSGATIRGAVVTVLGANRQQLARGLTSSSGSFRLPLGTGSVVRVIRIGFLPTEIPVDSSGTRLTIIMRPAGRMIAAVSIVANPLCPRRADQDQALALWSAATDALLAIVVASEDSAHTGLVTQLLFNRRLINDRVAWQSTRRTVTGNVSPIRADRHPDAFVEEGYVVEREGGFTYYAPDPEVLLDSSFAATHCLSLRTDGPPGLTGVAFAPTSNRRNRPDIAGTLWLSRAPLALHSLEFLYRGVPQAILDVRAGGRLEFLTPSDDVPIISRWHVRSPRLRGVRTMDRDNRVRLRYPVAWEVYETGGLIADGELAGGTSWSTPLATLRGRVRNAVADEPVRNARVTLDSTDQAALTDSAGNFYFEHLLPGPHVLRVIDSIQVRGELVNDSGQVVPDTVVMQRVTRSASQSIDVGLAAGGPLVVTLPWRAPVSGCGPYVNEKRFFVLGTVRTSTGSIAPNVPIQLSWADTLRGTRVETTVEARADSTGGFVMCGIPADEWLATRAVGPTGTVHTGRSRITSSDRAPGPVSRTTRALRITIPEPSRP